MIAVFKREFLSYFRTPVGWVAICLLSVISGYYFTGMMTGTVAYVNMNLEIAYLRTFFIILIPIITMRLFAEEKRNGTDVLLYTMPFSMKEAVIGKFLAAMALQVLMLVSVFFHMIITVILSGYISSATWGAIFGYLVLAALFISIGMLTSALTENQIMSAVVCFVVLLFFSMLSSIASQISDIFKSFLKFTHLFGLSESAIYSAGEGLRSVIVWFDPYTKTDCYTSGVFKLVPLVFCLSFTAVFIYITFRVLEKKRWSQN
ncbi:MAG: ABC transporter permease subunit [Clostridiales bacterium]|nr:ABC transporter permease subunit [Clostridiales bacterium]